MPTVVLSSIQVGEPQTLGRADADDPFEREWTTAIFKQPVRGAVSVGRTGIEGDGQADLSVHGGPDKAICAYAGEHYPAWQAELDLPDFGFGAFGENFTVDGANEQTVCLGDVYEVGTSVVEVSQPRQPCWKLARKWRIKTLTARVAETGLTGWYFRVLEPGDVEAGATFTLVDRPHPDWSLARANDVMHHRKQDAEAAAALAALPPLAESWRATLSKRVAG